MLVLIIASLISFGTLACASDQPREAKRNKSGMLKKSWEKRKFILIFILLVLPFSVSTVQAQETSYELLWSYEAGGTVNGVSVSSDGSYIAAGSSDEKVYFFNKEGEPLWGDETGTSVKSVSVSSDGSYIAVGRADNGYDILKRDFTWQKGSILATGDSVGSISISSEGRYIAYSAGNKVFFSSVENSNDYWSNEIGDHGYDYVTTVSISPDGSYIAAGSTDEEKVYFFDKNGKRLWDYGIDGFALGVSVSSGGNYIAVGTGTAYSPSPSKTTGITRTITRIYFLNKDGVLLWSYTISESRDSTYLKDVNSVSVSSDGSYLTAGAVDGKVYLFDREGTLLWTHDTGSAVESVSVSSNGNYIAVGSRDNKVYFFKRAEASSAIPTLTPTPSVMTPEVTPTPEPTPTPTSDAKEQARNEKLMLYGIIAAVSVLCLVVAVKAGGKVVRKAKEKTERKRREKTVREREKRHYEEKLNEYNAQLEQWRSEGYKVDELEELLK